MAQRATAKGMTLGKAIEVLDNLVTTGGVAPSEYTRDEAIRIGSEGLKRLKLMRIHMLVSLLPGETKDEVKK